MIALMKRILAVSGLYKRRIQRAFLFAFLKAMLSKAPIGLSFLALGAFVQGKMTPTMCLWLGIGTEGCVLLECICQNIADRLQAAAGYMVFADLRMELGQHLQHLPMGYFTEGNIGKISSVLSTDMVFIEENCMHDIADMMSYIFAQAILVVWLAFLNPWLGLIASVVVCIIWLWGRASLKDSLIHSNLRQEQSEALTQSVLDYVEGIGIAKTYNLLGERSKELTENFVQSRKVNIDFEEAQTPWMRTLYLMCGLGSVVIVPISFMLYSQGLISVTFLLGVLLFIFDIFAPIKVLFSQATRLTVMNACMDRIESVLEEPELPNEGTSVVPKESKASEVEFRHVSFAYGEKEVLHDISFQLNQNQMLALVGPSGGGKSTVANLLARFWDVKDGQVLIRGKDIRDIPLSELMNQISMVFQRVYLFQDTVYGNIAMGRPDATKEEVYEAAKKARCYDFIMNLPDGFDTVIGEGGASLSGGERQRISIARCILKDAPIVILDEATASVDADNESYIQEAITQLCKGKTLLVIAHRLNTIQHADNILVIDQGRIVQSGSHDVLMQQDGIYRRFVTVRSNPRGWNHKA